MVEPATLVLIYLIMIFTAFDKLDFLPLTSLPVRKILS